MNDYYSRSSEKRFEHESDYLGKSIQVLHPSTKEEFDEIFVRHEGVDVAKFPQLAERYDVRKIPISRGVDVNGNLLDLVLCGAHSIDEVHEFVRRLISPKTAAFDDCYNYADGSRFPVTEKSNEAIDVGAKSKILKRDAQIQVNLHSARKRNLTKQINKVSFTSKTEKMNARKSRNSLRKKASALRKSKMKFKVLQNNSGIKKNFTTNRSYLTVSKTHSNANKSNASLRKTSFKSGSVRSIRNNSLNGHKSNNKVFLSTADIQAERKNTKFGLSKALKSFDKFVKNHQKNFQNTPILKKRESTKSRLSKRKSFLSVKIDEQPLTAIPGIGVVGARKIQEEGCAKAKNLFQMYKKMGESELSEWLKCISIRGNHIKSCIDALKDIKKRK